MKLFIANPTTQRHEFKYSIRKGEKVITKVIHSCSQEYIGDFPQDVIDMIVNHHATYGLIAASDALTGTTKRRIASLMFSIGSAMTSTRIEQVFLNNQMMLRESGRKLRQDAAIATNNMLAEELAKQNLQTGLGANLRSVEVTVQEEEPKSGYDGKSEDHISEGFRIDPNAQDAANATRRGRRG